MAQGYPTILCARRQIHLLIGSLKYHAIRIFPFWESESCARHFTDWAGFDRCLPSPILLGSRRPGVTSDFIGRSPIEHEREIHSLMDLSACNDVPRQYRPYRLDSNFTIMDWLPWNNPSVDPCSFTASKVIWAEPRFSSKVHSAHLRSHVIDCRYANREWCFRSDLIPVNQRSCRTTPNWLFRAQVH